MITIESLAYLINSRVIPPPTVWIYKNNIGAEEFGETLSTFGGVNITPEMHLGRFITYRFNIADRRVAVNVVIEPVSPNIKITTTDAFKPSENMFITFRPYNEI